MSKSFPVAFFLLFLVLVGLYVVAPKMAMSLLVLLVLTAGLYGFSAGKFKGA